MKEKSEKKRKRPQTEDMIFTEEDFEDVSEETKANSPNTGKGLAGLQVDFRPEKRGSSQAESSECWCFYILEFLYFL